jgi:aspartyl-tRNA(Asn)/glutamyl-tRNA(Gln) amidotransferase subunit A
MAGREPRSTTAAVVRSHGSQLTTLDAVSLREGYAQRAFSPVEVVEAILARIEELNPSVNAYVTVAGDLAREQARLADRAYRQSDSARPPLLGVPFSVKDTIATQGIRTTMGSRSLERWVPTFDAPAVERCRRAGGVLLGKTNSPEFGWKGETTNTLFGTTLNPWRLDRTPGGSSGGAAAAVALGMGPLALGTDAAGSTRIPAAFCGIVGYKPSFGRIPMFPGGPLETLGHIGVLARSVRDVALMLEVTTGPDARDRLCLPGPAPAFGDAVEQRAAGLRAAWSPDLGFAAVNAEVLALAETAAQKLPSLGWELVELEAALDDPYPLLETLLAAGMAGAVRDTFESVRALLDPERVPLIERGFALSGADVGAAIMARAQWVEGLRALVEPYDVLVTPSVPLEPFAAGISAPALVGGRERPGLSWAALSYPFNLSGQPAVSVPCGMTAGGLPVGLQIVGRTHDDMTLLSAAAAIEHTWPWHDAWPSLVGDGGRSDAA